MTKRLLATACLLGCLALPASALAHPPSSNDQRNAAKHCKDMRGTTDASREAFAAQWGTNKTKSNAFGKCVSSHAKEEHAERHAAKRSASRDCREERQQNGAQQFRLDHGTNKNKSNAFGKCVSKKAKQKKAALDRSDRKQNAEFRNAAKACDAERAQSPAAFEANWGGPEGTNRNDAFGKCVSATARS
jgi:hypothetical protein